jgi:hypothetical protein
LRFCRSTSGGLFWQAGYLHRWSLLPGMTTPCSRMRHTAFSGSPSFVARQVLIDCCSMVLWQDRRAPLQKPARRSMLHPLNSLWVGPVFSSLRESRLGFIRSAFGPPRNHAWRHSCFEKAKNGYRQS